MGFIYKITNIEQHRKIMTKIKGRKVSQYTKDNKLVKEYNSISEEERLSGIKKTII